MIAQEWVWLRASQVLNLRSVLKGQRTLSGHVASTKSSTHDPEYWRKCGHQLLEKHAAKRPSSDSLVGSGEQRGFNSPLPVKSR
jgi:hypothetical protein